MSVQIEDVIERCHVIYKRLGTSHHECVYQKALVIELYHMGAISVESEKNVPVFYTDSRGLTHTIGTERVDIYVRFPDNRNYVLELKATTQGIRNHVEVQQLLKYEVALCYMKQPCSELCVINFKQQVSQAEEVDWLVLPANNRQTENITQLD